MASLKRLVRRHLKVPIEQCPVVNETFANYETPNIHLALEQVLGQEVARRPYGVPCDATLAGLARAQFWSGYTVGPPEFADLNVGVDQRLACVARGLFLVHDQQREPVVLLLGEVQFSHPPQMQLEAMAASREVAEKLLRKIGDMTRQGQAYRGKVFSLERDCYGGTNVQFHHLPDITRDEIVLPAELLQRIERHSVSFSRHAERLRASGRHLKRGILLHGPPGTGKTLTAMYLAAQMEGRTVIIITGGGINSIEAACHLARLLQPTTVILEDVDLIGTEREHQAVGANALLFELLNQMDGLGDDCDVLFVLTTNRPDVLEPALAARPGRIDQALEVPLPDADCRKRLLQLYGQGLNLQLSEPDRLVARLEGASAAFVRELLRKAALMAAEESSGPGIEVHERHLNQALSELIVAGGQLTQSLLGSQTAG